MLETDLTKFGARELNMAKSLLDAISKGYPDDFDCEWGSEVKLAFDTNSGDVFLTNNNFQVRL